VPPELVRVERHGDGGSVALVVFDDPERRNAMTESMGRALTQVVARLSSDGAVRAVDDVNTAQKTLLYRKVAAHYGDALGGKRFAVWGLSFKPRTDDMREAPSLTLINELLLAGAKVNAYDPVAMHEAAHLLGDSIYFSKNAEEAAEGADALVLVTEWPEFRLPDFDVLGKSMSQKVLFDGRNIYDGNEVRNAGFTYYGIGVNGR